VALRKDYENVRLADHTNDLVPGRMMRAKSPRPQGPPAASISIPLVPGLAWKGGTPDPHSAEAFVPRRN